MTILDPFSFEVSSGSEEQTLRLGARLGALLPKRMCVALQGELGAGKTAFSRGVGEGWNADQPLRSPTFTLVQCHRRDNGDVLYHVDLYRVQNTNDLASIGLEEILDADAICLIEWSERASHMIPSDALRVDIRVISETKRQLKFSANSEETWKILVAFRKSAFGI
jgi:tRNA threonylcarbamoyladenosine biosynthesis protein TsaE